MMVNRPAGSIAHVVLVEWRANAPASALDELADAVNAFPRLIPGVLDVAQGKSVSPEGLEGGFDWGLVVTFADFAARDGYLPHAAHAPVSALIGEWSERVVVFDIAY